MRLLTEERQRLDKHIQYWSIVDEGNGCWLWNRYRNEDGYAEMSFRAQKVRVHRLSFAVFNDDFDDCEQVLHSCDVPHCCNPDHLFLGNPAINTADMIQKQRKAVLLGEDHGYSKLTEIDVREIVRLRKGGATYREIGDRFGITPQNVWRIISGKTWKHLFV